MILTTMTNAGLIHEVKTDDEKTFAYAPAFRIDNMNIEHCIRRIQNAGINDIEFKDDETFHKISAIVDGFKIPENTEITNI